ncbi:hypothetical protein EEL30_14200 [Brevibacillus laterosporus]|uniref:Uncharacterized protein n=1 Tax=Brevibacillus laterosporus TaxID=1465 RepID=A0A518V8L9_BRELA|nr:hypothetical protein EEL30_14200 [Brevibacillus laterosporus]
MKSMNGNGNASYMNHLSDGNCKHSIFDSSGSFFLCDAYTSDNIYDNASEIFYISSIYPHNPSFFHSGNGT